MLKQAFITLVRRSLIVPEGDIIPVDDDSHIYSYVRLIKIFNEVVENIVTTATLGHSEGYLSPDILDKLMKERRYGPARTTTIVTPSQINVMQTQGGGGIRTQRGGDLRDETTAALFTTIKELKEKNKKLAEAETIPDKTKCQRNLEEDKKD